MKNSQSIIQDESKREVGFGAIGYCTVALIMILLMALMTISGCGNADAEGDKTNEIIRPVRAVQLKQAPSESVIVFPGKAKALKEVSLSFRVGGPLNALAVDDGMKVKKGDLIARIDVRDFKVTVKTLEAKLAASKAQYAEAKRQYKRYENLVKANAASKSAFDQMKAGYEMAEAQVRADSKSLEAAKNALKDTALYAPFDGYVDKVFIENHETVGQGQPIVTVVDLSKMEIGISLPETLLPVLDNFTAFECEFTALPGVKHTAKIKQLIPKYICEFVV